MPKRPTKAELRKALAAFIPPDANLEWGDAWKPASEADEPTKPNSQQAARRAPTTPDDPQAVDGRDGASCNMRRSRRIVAPNGPNTNEPEMQRKKTN